MSRVYTIRFYYQLHTGKLCTCSSERDLSNCTLCYGTGFVGGYRKGEKLEAVEAHRSYNYCSGDAELIVRDDSLPILMGDKFIHKDERWKVVTTAQFSTGMKILSYRKVESHELFYKFPLEEVQRR